MKTNGNYRMDMVLSREIKRLPGIKDGISQKRSEKIRNFAGKRGCYMPVVLSETDGSMTLLAGAATFKACLEEKVTKVPAMIVRTEGEADNLMFALQTAELDETLDAISVSAAIVRLIDVYGTPRKQIAESLGKSPAWVNKMEGLSRKLVAAVRDLVTEGHITSRAAQEIARLPDHVQMAFAVSAGNEYLSKNSVAYLVNRYLNDDASSEERDRIIHTPGMALPDQIKSRNARAKDLSDSARLSRAIARGLDATASLSNLLDRIDIGRTAVNLPDIAALLGGLAALRAKLAPFLPGEKEGRAMGKRRQAADAGGGAND